MKNCFTKIKKILFAVIVMVSVHHVSFGEKKVVKIKFEETLPSSISDTLKIQFQDLVGNGQFIFKEIKSDRGASLNALGSSFSVEKKSRFYLYYVYFSKTIHLREGRNVDYGSSVFVIFKVSDLDSKLKINTPYDIAAAGQLRLATAQLEVKTFGLRPDAIKSFIPKNMGYMDVNSKEFLDQVLKSIGDLTNENTSPQPIPIITLEDFPIPLKKS